MGTSEDLVGAIFAVVGGIVMLLLALKGVHVVSQSRVTLVTRFGRHQRTLSAGLHFVVPFIEQRHAQVDLRQQTIPLPPQPATTQDELVVSVTAVVYLRVTDPRAAVFDVANYGMAIEQITVTAVRDLVSAMDLDQALVARTDLGTALSESLAAKATEWGVTIDRIEITSIDPPAAIQEARAQRVQAEEARRVRILTGEVSSSAAPARSATVLAHGGTGWEPVREPLAGDDPAQIGPHTLIARLGEGGMGRVYLGRTPGGRPVAIKVIHRQLASQASFRQRFSREIDAVRRVGGFHTSPVVDADPDGESPWLATEYIAGPTLAEVLEHHGALPIRSVQTLAAGVAEALEGIHSRGIVHRDLKPSNVIVSESGPRVIDFGIARALDSTQLTRTDHVIGTRGFLAPEQLTGAPVTFATDLYAFGMVICHAAGAAPFVDGEPTETALSLLPARLHDLVSRCLDHDSAKRPTAAEALADLMPGGPADSWLPPQVRTMVDLHHAATQAAG